MNPDFDFIKFDTQAKDDQIRSLKGKVERMYKLAAQLDQEALAGAWDERKEAKLRAAALIRQHLEG